MGLFTGRARLAKGLRLLPLLALIALAVPAGASAATINVTTTTDELDEGERCSLREAVTAANEDSIANAEGCPTAGEGEDTILIQAGRFTLSRLAPPPNGEQTFENANLYGDLDILDAVRIVHRGIKPAIIAQSRFFPGDRVLHVVGATEVTLQGLTITDGRTSGVGGGILNGGDLTVANSLIVDNFAQFGGGIATEGEAATTLVNTTLSDNRASEDGGGVSAEAGGTVDLRSVTVSGNEADANRNGGGNGGGIFASTGAAAGTITLKNTLIAGNEDQGGEADECARIGTGKITSLGHNLIANTNGCGYTQGSGDVLNRGAQLKPLAENGGATQTHALRRGSPAINAGVGCPARDQRGLKRNLGGRRCDIGAWELARCRGVVINVIGTGGPELLIGTEGADGILGLGSSDTLRGLDGDDGLCGGGGSDLLVGGPGRDGLNGEGGRDTCRGGPGRDKKNISCELPRRR